MQRSIPPQPPWRSADLVAGFRSTAPRHVLRRYLSGECDVLATALMETTKQSLWAMINGNGQIEHVFVRDTDSGLAIDIRGAMALDDIAEGSALEYRPHEFHKTDINEVVATFGMPDAAQMREARKAVKHHLAQVIKRVAVSPAEISLEP